MCSFVLVEVLVGWLWDTRFWLSYNSICNFSGVANLLHLVFINDLELGIGGALCGLRCGTYVKQIGLQIFVEVLY